MSWVRGGYNGEKARLSLIESQPKKVVVVVVVVIVVVGVVFPLVVFVVFIIVGHRDLTKFGKNLCCCGCLCCFSPCCFCCCYYCWSQKTNFKVGSKSGLLLLLLLLSLSFLLQTQLNFSWTE